MADIVVIEDNTVTRELWLEILQLKGHKARGYALAQQALDAIQSEPPQLVVVDLGLPDMCGREVVTEIRREFCEARLPVVVVSGSEAEHDMLQAFNAGATDYLVKPVGPAELSSKVQLHLRHSERLSKITLSSDYCPGSLACGRYLIEHTMGEGTYGVVYAARAVESGEEVALKVLRSEAPIDRRRFLRECYTLAGLDHPGVARVVDFGEEDGVLFLAMERVVGWTVERWVLEHGVADERETWELAMGLVGAIEVLEGCGVLHRDLKPANIVLRDGEISDPVLIDFGLAKRAFDIGLTSPSVMLGTPGYMPPEVLSGDPLDSRSDLYALGMVARFAATGQEPYPHLYGYQLLERMARSAVQMPDRFSPSFRTLLMDLTALDRDQRIGSAQELRTRLLASPPAGGPQRSSARLRPSTGTERARSIRTTLAKETGGVPSGTRACETAEVETELSLSPARRVEWGVGSGQG
ncbi:MAG: protein kinase [Planctomycetes bacterium]|nr:protein kinase [Planctomycetota bacterium]